MIDQLRRLFKRWKEIINTFLYDSQRTVLSTLYVLTAVSALTGIGLFIYYHGFRIEPADQQLINNILEGIIGLFVLNYLIRIFYVPSSRKFLKKTWFEGILILGVLIYWASHFFFPQPLFQMLEEYTTKQTSDFYYLLTTQLVALFLILINFSHISRQVFSLQIKPATLFLISFLILIAVGTLFLSLPEMTVPQCQLSLVDALFTATSATCVTGLIVVDTGTCFTLKGQIVILFLMQLGGLGIITFATFFASFLKAGAGIRHQVALQEIVNKQSLHSTLQLLRQIVFYTLMIEAIGIVTIHMLWGPELSFSSNWEKAFYSIFHAVSAFCNAGFDLLGNSLYTQAVREQYVLHLVFAALIVLGGLGFPVLQDLFSASNLRKRLRQPWRGWQTHTKIVVNSSIILIIAGTIGFYFLEQNNVLQGLTTTEGVIGSLFQSITTRTAGFNTLDTSQLTIPTLLFFIFLMFIGASPASTGGGIKTSTFVVILSSVKSTIRGKHQVEYGSRTISNDLLFRAFAIVVFSTLFVFIITFLLTLTESGNSLIAIIFEAVSAFGTVGLSTGITSSLTTAGKIIIIVAMFIGRIGPLTLAFALSSTTSQTSYSYPTTNVMVG